MRFIQIALPAWFTAAAGVHAGSDQSLDLGNGAESSGSRPAAKVVNLCPFDVYLWTIGWETDGPYKVHHGEVYTEEYERGGVALEIVKERKSWYKDYDKLVFYYKLDDGRVSYDLYEKHGHPFTGHTVELKPDKKSCPKQIWNNGCAASDRHDKKCCAADDCIVLYLCAGEDGLRTAESEMKPALSADQQESELPRRSDADAPDWHVQQWEHDKPDWETDGRCTDCGPRVGGTVKLYVGPTE